MWADTLKRAETEYSHEAFQALQGEQWAAPLLLYANSETDLCDGSFVRWRSVPMRIGEEVFAV